MEIRIVVIERDNLADATSEAWEWDKHEAMMHWVTKDWLPTVKGRKQKEPVV